MVFSWRRVVSEDLVRLSILMFQFFILVRAHHFKVVDAAILDVFGIDADVVLSVRS